MKLNDKARIIAVDFDGTIAYDAWPVINVQTTANHVVLDWLKKRQSMGDKVILWTCRENFGGPRFPDREYRNEALQFCTRNGLFFHNVNSNDGEVGYEPTKFGRKVLADVYLDDKALPFSRSDFCWKVYLWLMDRKLKKLG